MPGDRKPKGNLIPVKTLAGLSGVSVQTIHYYLHEGLLTPPVKTARNMAYYDPICVQEIKYIKELQTQKYLPLSAIKVMLQARRGGQAADHIVEMGSFFENLFQPLKNDSGKTNISKEELAQISGLSAETIDRLTEMGLLAPVKSPQGAVYGDIDIRLAQIFKKLIDMGLKASDFSFYKNHLEIMRKEVHSLHELLHRLPDHDSVSLKELFTSLGSFRDLLYLRVMREEAQEQYLVPPMDEKHQ